MIGIIIQARIGSSRLPNKIFLPYYKEKGILELLIEKLKLNINSIPIIVATTINGKDDKVEELTNKLGIPVYRGSEDNVLQRFREAAKFYGINGIIRICADNPFLDVTFVKKLINSNFNSYDYISFKTVDGTPVIKTHFGFFAEYVTLDALNKVQNQTNEPLYKEHVTNFIYSNPTLFAQKYFSIPIEIEKKNVRLTVDTAEDFDLSKEIYSCVIKENLSNSSELVEYISKRPEWMKRMKEQIKLNEK